MPPSDNRRSPAELLRAVHEAIESLESAAKARIAAAASAGSTSALPHGLEQSPHLSVSVLSNHSQRKDGR